MAFSPGVASLAHLGTHPRLHLTPTNLATYQTRFASGDLYTAWKNLITALESTWSYSLTQFFATNYYFPGDLYALVYMIGAIAGDGRSHTIQQYGEKAAEHLNNFCATYGTACTMTASGTTVTVTQTAHGYGSTSGTTTQPITIIGADNDAFNGFFYASVPDSDLDPDHFTYTATRGTPPATGTGYSRKHWTDPQYERGYVLNHVAQCYDWLCGYALGGGDDTALLSDAQRAVAVKYLMDAAEAMRVNGSPNQSFWIGTTIQRLHSSGYFESHQLFPWALACWNEQSVNGIGDRDTQCQAIMDHWETINLSGSGLDAQNWGGAASPWAEYGAGGGTAEIADYTLDRCMHWDMAYNAMRTACDGLNYLTTATDYPATWMRYAPYYLAYMLNPCNLVSLSALYMGVGQTGINSGISSSQQRRAALRAIAGLNSFCGYTNSAGLAKWLMAQWSITAVPSYSYNALTFLLTWDPDQAAVAPASIPLPHLYHLPRQGVYIRTTYGNDPSATVIWMGLPDYWLDGHSWDVEGTGYDHGGDEPMGLMIYKHGPLLIRRGAYIRGNPNHRNHMTFVDPVKLGDGLREYNANYTSLSQYVPSCLKYVGGVTNIFSDETRRADLVEATTTGMYLPTLMSSSYSKWIVFRGADSAKDDYVIEYSTANLQAGKGGVTKRWQGNCPYQPAVDGAGWISDSGYQWHSDDGTLVTVDNRNWESGDPIVPALTTATIKGRLFVKPLMPSAFTLRLRGGTGYEFMDDSGGSTYNPFAGTSADITVRNSAGHLHCGSHYFLIESEDTSSTTERFLIAFQASDSTVVPTAKTMDLVSASNIRGVHIKDATNGDKVGIFSYDGTVQASYTYTVTVGAAGAVHLVSGLDSGKTYDVTRNGVLIVSDEPATRGAICFDSASGTGTFIVANEQGEILPKIVLGIRKI